MVDKIKTENNIEEDQGLGLYGFLIFGGIAAFFIYNNLIAKKPITFFGDYINDYNTDWLKGEAISRFTNYEYIVNDKNYYQQPKKLVSKVPTVKNEKASKIIKDLISGGLYGFLV